MRKIIYRIKAGVVPALMIFYASAAYAGQSSETFNVNIDLNYIPSSTGICTKSHPLDFGARVIISCATGAILDVLPGKTGGAWPPMHGGAHHYVFQIGQSNMLTTVESYLDLNSVVSWRVINLTDRDYLEMLVGW